MNKKELFRLVKLAKAGNQEAINSLVFSHEKLIYNICHKFLRKYNSIEIEDLFQEGVCGILKAIDKFDLKKEDIKFTTLAQIYICNFISIYIRNNSRTVRFPSYLINLYKKIKNYQDDYLNREGYLPSIKEICNNLNITINNYNNAILLENESASLDSLDQFEKNTLLDNLSEIKTENLFFDEGESIKLDKLLKNLTSEEKQIIIDWSGVTSKRLSYKQIAKKYNKDIKEVTQIVDSCKNKIYQNKYEVIKN